jgi:bacillithiol biosynthesis cysteine-adding enzyme BshC
MLKLSHTSFENTKALNALVFAYINKKEELDSLYQYFPDKNGFAEIIKSNLFEKLNRNYLRDILIKQTSYTKNSSPQCLNNIELLKEKNTFTITTGHQLCLFTGPLYFIYKIFSTINLAEELKKQYPQSNFVPVYWMASEDHDFEEVNHFNVYGKNIKWETGQKGAVGDFNTTEIESVFNLFKEIVGQTKSAEYLIQLFEKSYLKHNNLKNATRYIVNELFGKYGLIIIDGNDVEFKNQTKNIFKKDIFENTAFTSVTDTIQEFNKLKYESQVNPREINCFYMEDGLRARIEKNGEDYKIIGAEIKFTKQELENLIDNHSEKISPNVVLRPLYQQTILPNIAYVGGPGELAYWLQYKKMFNVFNVQYPILVPRNFVTAVDANTKSKIEKLNFLTEDFFKTETELINMFQTKSNNVFDLEIEQAAISKIYISIKDKINLIDKTLINSAAAEEQKTLKSLELLVQKANKALKQKSETEINKIKQIKQKLFPSNLPQERFDNFSAYYISWGEEFFEFLKNNLNPLNFSHCIITED